DYAAYIEAQTRVDAAYRDRRRWAKMAILNTARVGKIASHRTIEEYNRDIRHLTPNPVEEGGHGWSRDHRLRTGLSEAGYRSAQRGGEAAVLSRNDAFEPVGCGACAVPVPSRPQGTAQAPRPTPESRRNSSESAAN